MQKVSLKAGVIMQQPLLEEVQLVVMMIKKNLILLFPIPRFMLHKNVFTRPISEQQAIIIFMQTTISFPQPG